MQNRAQKLTIGEIVKGNLCTGCGTCIALCPNEAIGLIINENKGIYIPKLNDEKCNSCGICYEVCPGHSVDFKELNLEIFGKEPDDVLIGNYTNCYIGHANNHEIRYNSAAGGLVTQLLIFALDEGIIDGALVTRMKKSNPLEPEPFIARTREEIIESSKSKYCPVPANLALKEILKEEGKFAVVGLPCHIQGIRKAEMVNNKLKEKIVMHLGILCSFNRNFLGTEYLLKKFNIKKEDVAKLDYRGEGWMGGMSITLKNGNKKFSPYLVYSGMQRSYFVPIRCTLCSDQSCELADISFGDIWLPEFFRDDKIGTSVIISRNKIGEQILQNAVLKRKIELINIDRNKVVESQKYSLFFKKISLNARIFLFKIFGKSTPFYNQELSKQKFSAYAYLHGILIYLQIYISSKRYLWGVLGAFALLLGGIDYCKRKIDNIIHRPIV
jgi:coenzyme F420 hydrogenase subunit beta